MNRALAATGRSVRRLLFYVVLPLVVVGLITWEFLLPDLIERAARGWLAANNRGKVDFTIDHIDLGGATIGNVALADRTITIDQVTVDYTPDLLRNGQAERVIVSGLRWSTRLVDGALDLAPLRRLVGDRDPEAAQPTASVPVPLIELRDAEVTLETGAGLVTLPLSASLEIAEGGDVSGRAQLHPRLPNGALTADLTFGRRAADGALEVFIDIADGWLQAPAISAVGLSGQVALYVDPETGPWATGYVETAHLNTPLGDLPGAASFTIAPSAAEVSVNLVTTDGALALAATADAALTPRPNLDYSIEVAVLSDTALARRSFSIIEVGRPAPRLAFSGHAETDDLDRILNADGIVDALSGVDADGALELAVAGVTVPRLVSGLDARADLSFALTGGAAIIDAETLSLSAQKFDGQLFGVRPGDLAHAYLVGGGTLSFSPRDGSAVTAISDADGRIDMSVAGDLRLDLGEILAVRAGADRIHVLADPVSGHLSWQTVERGDLEVERWSGRPFGLALTDARASVEGKSGAFTGHAVVEAQGDLVWPGGLRADNSRLTVATDLAFSGDYLTVRLARPDFAAFGALAIPGEVPISVNAIALSAAKTQAKPLLDLRFGDDGDIALNASLALRPIPIGAAASPPDQPPLTVALDLPALTLSADARLTQGAPPTYAATAKGRGGAMTVESDQDVMPGLPAKLTAQDIAVSVSAASDAPLAVTVEAARVAQAAAKPLLAPLGVSASAEIGAGVVDFDVRLREGSGNLAIDIDGRHDIARAQGVGGIELFPLIFLEDGLQPGRLTPFFAPRIGLTTGTLSLSGPVAWSDAGVTSDLLLTIENLNTAFDEVTVAGVNAAITIDRLIPPSTPPSQLVAIAGVDLGLPLTNGLVSLRLDRDGKPLVERSQWQWAGGKVATSMSRADAAGESDLLVLEIDGIGLDQLLELTPQASNIEATGTLFGRIPVVFRGGAFVIVDGWLESSFEGGELRYAADELAPGLLAGGEGVGLLLEALDNFHYSRLRVDLTGLPDGETEMRFRIRGSNPDLYGGAEVELNMGIAGRLEQILRQSYEAYYKVPEEVARKLAGSADRQAEDGQ